MITTFNWSRDIDLSARSSRIHEAGKGTEIIAAAYCTICTIYQLPLGWRQAVP